LAKQLKISRPQLINIEKGFCGTSAQNLYEICCILNISPNDLFPSIKLAIEIPIISKEIIIKIPKLEKVMKSKHSVVK